jgi:hypothetical protein
MRRILAALVVVASAAAVPTASRADYCSAKGSLSIRSDFPSGAPAYYWADFGAAGCGSSPIAYGAAPRASVADTNYIAPLAATMLVQAETPDVTDTRYAPQGGYYRFDGGAWHALFFAYDGNAWQSQNISIPTTAHTVTAKACVFPKDFTQPCKTWTVNYLRFPTDG